MFKFSLKFEGQGSGPCAHPWSPRAITCVTSNHLVTSSKTRVTATLSSLSPLCHRCRNDGLGRGHVCLVPLATLSHFCHCWPWQLSSSNTGSLHLRLASGSFIPDRPRASSCHSQDPNLAPSNLSHDSPQNSCHQARGPWQLLRLFL